MFPEIRLKEAVSLGFKRGIVPSQPFAQELHRALEAVCVRDLKQAQEALFS
jgi:predicted ATP-dependent serine protease